MSRPLRSLTAGTFFITAITAQRWCLFQKPANAELFLQTLQHYRKEGLYKLYAFVVMPDHVHLLLTTEDLPRAMKHIRGGFSHRLQTPHEVWQRGYSAHDVRTREKFFSYRDYIHENPIRARLSKNCEGYPYSSAYVPATKVAEEGDG